MTTAGPIPAEPLCDRDLPRASQIVLSFWHLRLCHNANGSDPGYRQTEDSDTCLPQGFSPFCAAACVCIGAGFTMVEGPLVRSDYFEAFDVRTPEPEEC
jgi:hypothetical protein